MPGFTDLADIVLVLHFLLASAIAGGFLLILLGARRGWGWVRGYRLRLAHLAAIVFIALESLAGMACPLTVWEDLLRGTPPGGPGFIARHVGRILYWNLPPAAFALLYCTLALLAVFLWRRFPPVHRNKR